MFPNLETITIGDCVEAYEMRGYTFEINDGKVTKIIKEKE